MMTGLRACVAQKPLFTAADTQELLAFKLTDSGIDGYYKATMAIAAFAKAHPNMKVEEAEDDKKASDVTISDMDARYSKVPQCDAIMNSNGIATRQYVDTMRGRVPGMVMVDM